MTAFFDMGGYAQFVWPAYAATIAVLGAAVAATLAAHRAAKARLAAAERSAAP